MKSSLPPFVKKYFWGDDLNLLDWSKHCRYITKTILERGDEKAIAWLMKKASKENLRQSLTSLKLDPKSANFWKIYLS